MRTLPRISAIAVLLSLITPAFSSTGQEGRDIARNAFPSVVLVVAENSKPRVTSLGSGFFVQNDLVLTNYHVIKGSSRIRVKLVDHRETYRAQVVTISSAKDLAFLKVFGIQAPPLSFGDVGQVAVGDAVYAIGNPEGLEATLSQGIVSGIRQIGGKRYFQISAPISHGSSGGPILNKSGEVIGIAVGALRSGQNLNFAIPISEVVALMNGTPDTEAERTDTTGLVPKTEQKPPLGPYGRDEINKAIDKVRKQPNSAEAHFVLAETYRQYGLFEGITWGDAINEYKRVIQLEPNQVKAYFGLAESYLEAALGGDQSKKSAPVEAAITYYKQAIRIDPDYAEAHVGLCEAYSYVDRHDEAIAACRLAIRLSPGASRAYIQLGHAYWKAELYDDAISAYKTAVGLVPNDSSVYMSIGWVYESTARYQEAIPYYQQAIKLLDPSLYSAPYEYSSLLRCYKASGRLEEGIKYFRQLTVSLGAKPMIYKEGTTSTGAHYALGMMYVYSNDTKAALEQYKILKGQGKGRPAELAEELFGQIYK